MRLLQRRGSAQRRMTDELLVIGPASSLESSSESAGPSGQLQTAVTVAESSAWPGPRVFAVRAGLYAISESGCPRAGTVQGDYVIGFTVRYRQVTRRYSSMEKVMEFIVAEYQRRQDVGVIAS